VQRQYLRQCSALDALRETHTEATQREALATERADRSEALADSLRDECLAWEDAYKALAIETRRQQMKAESQRRSESYLRTALVQAHDSLEATREELCNLRQVVTAASPGSIPASVQTEAVSITVSATDDRDDITDRSAENMDHSDAVPRDEYEVVCRRATIAETQHRTLQEQWRELLADSTAAKLELEFCMKRLGLRNERISNLMAGLKKMKQDMKSLQTVRDTDKQRYSEALARSKEEASHWRAEAEKMRELINQLKGSRSANASLGQFSPLISGQSPGGGGQVTPNRTLGSHFTRYIRGGSAPQSPSNAQAASNKKTPTRQTPTSRELTPTLRDESASPHLADF
jgi:hypothetical protein